MDRAVCPLFNLATDAIPHSVPNPQSPKQRHRPAVDRAVCPLFNLAADAIPTLSPIRNPSSKDTALRRTERSVPFSTWRRTQSPSSRIPSKSDAILDSSGLQQPTLRPPIPRRARTPARHQVASHRQHRTVPSPLDPRIPAIGRALLILALVPQEVVHGYIWQLATYSFLHVDLWEILWNMLTLWMFGGDIELSWGTQRFLRFYFLCTIGPAIVVVLLSYLAGSPRGPGHRSLRAHLGNLLVCAVLWPDR